VKFVAIGTGNTFRSLTGQSRWMPSLSTGGGGNVSFNGWKLTGQGTGVMAGMFPPSAVASTNCPYIGLKLTWLGEP
jgi:hypothetical protein